MDFAAKGSVLRLCFLNILQKAAGYFFCVCGIKGNKPIVMKRHLPLASLALLILITSCNNTGQGLAANADERGTADSISYTGNEAVKLVKRAAITFKVKNVEQSARDVSALAQSVGGMVFDLTLSSETEDSKALKVSADSMLVISTSSPHADVTVRVPAASLERFMYSVADLGYYTSASNLHIDDKSLEYLQNALKQKARSEVLAHAPTIRDSNASLATLAIRDEAIGQQIQNRSIDADANYSTVNLSFFQNALVRKEVVANYVLTDYDLPFGKKLAHTLAAGWGYFLDLMLLLANLWAFLLLALAGFAAFRYRQSRNKLAVRTS